MDLKTTNRPGVDLDSAILESMVLLEDAVESRDRFLKALGFRDRNPPGFKRAEH